VTRSNYVAQIWRNFTLALRAQRRVQGLEGHSARWTRAAAASAAGDGAPFGMKRLAELVGIVTRLWVCAAHVCLCHMSRTALGVTWNSAASKEVVLVDFGPRFARKMATASSQVSLVLTRLADWPEVWPDPGRCRRKSTSSISPMAQSSSPSVLALARSQAPPGVANVANASHATRPSMFLPADDPRVHWVGVWAIWVVLESLRRARVICDKIVTTDDPVHATRTQKHLHST